MKQISIDPRRSVKQGIDLNHETVKRHTEIYNKLIEDIPRSSQGTVWLNPYGTAPLSGYLGIWSESEEKIQIYITDNIGKSIPACYIWNTVKGANLIPILGMVPGSVNRIEVSVSGNNKNKYKEVFSIETAPLPPTDREIAVYPKDARFVGFPIYEVTVSADDIPETLSELYFTAFAARYNTGADDRGMVRWYTTDDIPAWNFERLSNGHFLSAAPEFDEGKLLYEFDMVGRVYKVFVLDNQCHHSVLQLPDGNILLPSEYTGESREDGLSIIDYKTGIELAYYDIREILDTKRPPIPKTVPVKDWIHINQSYWDTVNNLLISSGRHQGIFGIDKDTAELAFILASHEDWSGEFEEFLLTPVDESENPLYDLSDPNDIENANKEFWPWGQHAVVEIPNATKGIAEFLVLDNGNYRSRIREHALTAEENYSRVVRYRVNLDEMTVTKVYEYGKEEVGNRGYSSYVSNAELLENGNYLVNFGGGTFDENGRRRTTIDDFADISDPLSGEMVQGMVLIQEVNPITGKARLEFTCTSGRFKGKDEGKKFTVDLYSFRTHKLTLIP